MRRQLFLASFAAILAVSGCDCSGGVSVGTACTTSSECGDLTCIAGTCQPRGDGGGFPGCVDRDGDGRGAGCVGGPDCDDADADRGGVEICDDVDNDCDREVDEEVKELCGAQCTPQCQVTQEPGEGGFMPNEMNSMGVVLDPSGGLTLERMMTMSFAIWVANTDDGTVSKLDSRTNTEVARYPSIGDVQGLRAWNEGCQTGENPAGNCPSRTAVDQNFDAYVSNRAFGGQGSVTKYANEESRCIDRNQNGRIDTSRDINGNGTIETGGPEFVGPTDECILWTTPIGRSNGVPRALAIGLAPPDTDTGDVWVGLYDEAKACRIESQTGIAAGCVDLDGIKTYGAASDSNGRIWFVDRTGSRRDVLGYVDSSTLMFRNAPEVPTSVVSGDNNRLQPYGITVDGAGNVYVANPMTNPGVLKYDPASMTWTGINLPNDGSTRGVAADETSLWVAVSNGLPGRFGDAAEDEPDARVEQFDLATLAHVRTHMIPRGRRPVGVGVSFDGSIWAICQRNDPNGIAARLDPMSNTWIEHEVGKTPYTYSDFIGYGLNVFAQPRGSYKFVVEGCDDGAVSWKGVTWRGDVPAGTIIEFHARSADTRAGLATAMWIGPFTGNPANFSMPPGPIPPRKFLEVEARLITQNRTAVPILFDIGVVGLCEQIVE